MATALIKSESPAAQPPLFAWPALFGLPLGVVAAGQAWPRWIFMWALALAAVAGFKLFTYLNCAAAAKASVGRKLVYLLLWPGMDADGFFAADFRRVPILWWELPLALAKTLLGTGLMLAARPLVADHPYLAAWTMLTGIAFCMHFGLLHMFSIGGRKCGLNTPPLMRNPVRAASLSDFWGRRWNLAFRDLAHAFIFRPLARKFDAGTATLGVFVFSGLVHDAVISTAVPASLGLPSLYFLIQAAGFFAERSRLGRRRLNGSLLGRAFTAAVILLPLPLLFPPPFLRAVVLPMVHAVPHFGIL